LRNRGGELTNINQPFLQDIGDIGKSLGQFQSRLQDQQKSEGQKENEAEHGQEGGNSVGQSQLRQRAGQWQQHQHDDHGSK